MSAADGAHEFVVAPEPAEVAERLGVPLHVRGIEDKTELGRVRWVVERAISWLLRFKRLECATTAPNAPSSHCSPWPWS